MNFFARSSGRRAERERGSSISRLDSDFFFGPTRAMATVRGSRRVVDRKGISLFNAVRADSGGLLYSSYRCGTVSSIVRLRLISTTSMFRLGTNYAGRRCR